MKPRLKKIGLLVALGLLLVGYPGRAFADEAAEKTVDAYLLSGQSNMVGSGQVSELAEKWQQPIQGAYFFRDGAFDTLVAGKSAKRRQFGPEVGFAHYLRNHPSGSPNIYIIKFALGGQPLDAGWTQNGAWAGPQPGPNRKTFYPGTSMDDPNIGLHYKRLATHVNAALKKLIQDGYRPKLRGIVWMQGESDSKHEIASERYDRSLGQLKKRIEEDFGAGKNVPFVFGQVLPHKQSPPRLKYRDLIRKRMAQAHWNSGTKHAIENVWMVSTDGMDLLKDNLHYSTQGQLTLGQAFGKTMLAAHQWAEQHPPKDQ